MRTSKKTIALLAGAALATLSLGALAACNDEEHTLSLIEEQAATCTNAGHEAYYLCSHCGKLFADENAETEISDADVTIAALGHEMTHHEAVAATCTEDGNLEYWSCSRCELNFSDAEGTKEIASVAIPAGHDIGWVELVEPTASAEGMLAHYECSVCHTCFEDAYGEKELDREELVLAKLVSQDISVKVEVYDTAGNLVASPDYAALGRELVLKGEYSSNRYDDLEIDSDGTLSLTSAVVGKYEVDLYGYARSVFTVEEGTSEYTLKLSMTIAYGSNDKVTVNDAEGSVSIAAQDMSANMWTGSAELILPAGIDNNFFVFETTLKMGDFEDGWTTGGTQQRYAIQLTEQNTGFYFWSWTADGVSKTFVRRFAVNNLNNAMAENIAVNGDEAANGYMTDALRSDSGLPIRILRLDGEFVLLVMKEGAWNEVGRMEVDPDSPAKIVFYGVEASYTWSGFGISGLEFVPESEATAAEPGNYAYYTDGTRFWFEDGEETTAEGVKIYAPVSVTLTVNGIALDGVTAAAVPEGTVITLTGRANTYTYTVGGEAISEMVAGDYTMTAEGYASASITVPQEGGKIELTLQKVITIAGAVSDYTNNKWSDSVTLEISDDLKASTAVILEFTVKNITNSAAGWPTDEWASQRIAIQMAKGNEGFLFFLPKGEANIFDMTDGTIRDEGKTKFDGDFAWIDTLMRGESGVNMRIVRTGANVTLFVQNGESEWVKIGTVACGEAETEIVFYGCGVEWEFSSVTVGSLDYVAEKQPEADAHGNVAYYTDGENYWLADGTSATKEDIMLYVPIDVTFAVEGVALDGTTAETVAEGTVLTFTSSKSTYTYTVGETQSVKMSPDTYTVTAEGYASVSITVPEEGGTIELILQKVVTIGKGAVVLVNNAWNGQQTIAVPETVTGDFLLETTLKMSDFTQGFNDLGAWQRYAIRLTEGNVGFYFWSWNDGTAKTRIRQFSEENRTNAAKENDDVNGDEAGIGFITNELLDADGLQLRILRAGNTFYLYALNGSEWVKLGSVTCADGDKLDMEVYAGVGTYEWSNIHFAEISFVAEKAPVVGGSDGNVAYYTDGENYWLTDGTPATAEDVVLSAVEVKLTVNGAALDGTAAAVADGTLITLTGEYGSYSFKVGEAAPAAMLAGTYVVTAEGYAQTTLVVPKDGGDLTLTLKEAVTIAGAVSDYTNNKWSDSVTLEISDDLKASTAVILEFTVKNITNSAAGWPTDEWASQRIAIQMAKGNEGFLFFLPKGEANVFDMTDDTFGDANKTRFGENGSTFAWIDTLMRGENGVNMRIVRSGAEITLFVQNAEEAWVEIGTITCAAADAETEIVFYGCGVKWEFTSVTVTPAAKE